MTNTEQFNDAVTNNNSGANLIDQGDFVGALSKLSRALRCAKNSMSDCSAEDQENGGPSDLDYLMAKQRGSLLQESDYGYFVYDQPIRIPEALVVDSGDTTCNFPSKAVCSAISIFNLALAYHLMALRSSQNSQGFLKKSAKLYEFGMQISTEKTFFYLAILNNLADVHRRLSDSRMSRRFCEELLQTLMVLADSQKEASCTDDDTADTLDVFYQNSFFYLLSTRCVNGAPAA
jgi:hypothetical protein